ncbi:uncharacterized protein MONOS_14381 [Monocercomonoides exilis]|uniref:uncharacterized protein n=1 Tax=Monocercomonoides exilis TaxID=2049356 RepID=UPI00355A3149|nr:hypothetical protein MONOS_14381 [Monocercomonoides exilis]|eukprot:MONOS_14381.1-p1 / transcript=MONOS_14381.1 / gene=MONOS_14381 / organism=Monocercomonoides_exilis_PA203 / gene_product=unspecified product / transcript_product=unspecified product / location=Mono_scaffold00992:18500-19684(+) / protein_length=276 / sequence_SO=supercontig / SO=protein_coding / is_pseudo=false
MEEAKKADFRSKLSAEQRIGRQQEEPKAKTKTKEKDEFYTSQIDTFNARLAQAAEKKVQGLCNTDVFSSNSGTAAKDVLEPLSILLNQQHMCLARGFGCVVRMRGRERRRMRRGVQMRVVSYKDEKGSLCLTDKCFDNEKEEEEEEEEEEENGFNKDIRKAQKERGAKEKKKTTKEKNKPVTILTTLCSDFLPENKNRRRIQQQIIETPFTFSTSASASTSTSFSSSSYPILQFTKQSLFSIIDSAYRTTNRKFLFNDSGEIYEVLRNNAESEYG